MKTKYLLSALVLSGAFLFTSCEDEKEELQDAIIQSLPDVIQSKNDGNDVDYENVTVEYDKNTRRISVIGFSASGNVYPRIRIELADTLMETTYLIDNSNYQGIPRFEYDPIMDSTWYLVSGNITITNLDLDDELVGGNFNGIVRPDPSSPDSVLITEGVFAGKLN